MYILFRLCYPAVVQSHHQRLASHEEGLSYGFTLDLQKTVWQHSDANAAVITWMQPVLLYSGLHFCLSISDLPPNQVVARPEKIDDAEQKQVAI